MGKLTLPIALLLVSCALSACNAWSFKLGELTFDGSSALAGTIEWPMGE